MDYQPNESIRQTDAAANSSLPVVSLTLSIIGLFFSFVPVFGTICPSVAVALALLSRGGSMHTNGKSKVALILGILGIIITIVTTVVAIYYIGSHINEQTFIDFLNKASTSTGTYM